MAQNDVIKEIVFIADEQYEAPAYAWGTALAYLLALVVAELLTTFAAPLVGMILYGLILIALLVQSSIGAQKHMHHFLVILAILPLIRLLTMTIPLANFDPIYWYLLIGVLLSAAVFITARLTGLSGGTIGLRITIKELPAQLLIGLTGIGIGFVEYLILRPDPFISNFSWGQFLLFALILLIFAGLLQEIIFRGLLQTSAINVLGRFGILYVALVFALLHLGYRSLWDLLFIILVGLGFGVVAARTRSLVGVSLSHGLANVGLFLVFPLLMVGTAAKAEPALVISVPVVSTPTPVNQGSPTPTFELEVTQPLVLIPVTGPTATPIPPAEQQAACDSHSNWVVYVVQAEDTLESISNIYEISLVELRRANCFEDSSLVQSGQGLFVPFDLLLSPTPTQRVLFSSLNTPSATPTKKPTRKPPAIPTSDPVQEITPIPSIPTATLVPPSPPPQELPTLAPTQQPPPPPPTPED
jgi:hypothetical protein